MDTLSYLGQGFGVALSPYNLVTALTGTLIGTVVGLLPGLGPINGVALLIPIAFALGLPPESALILLAAVYLGCEYGGRISSILLNIPGEASTVMTTLDGYPMARQGLAGVALSLSAWSSFIGAFIATCGMVLFAPLLAKWAIAFGPAEYFVLMVFAIVALGGMAGDKPLKTFIAALIACSCRRWVSTPTAACTASPATVCTWPTVSSSWCWCWGCSRSARSSCCWRRPTMATWRSRPPGACCSTSRKRRRCSP